jgi:hypothetical protein
MNERCCTGYKDRIIYKLNEVCHREDGPAIEWSNGDKEWYINGERHREDGPAVVRVNGTREWWIYGKRHRKGGPAVIRANGIREWWIDGNETKEDSQPVGGFRYNVKVKNMCLHNSKCFGIFNIMVNQQSETLSEKIRVGMASIYVERVEADSKKGLVDLGYCMELKDASDLLFEIAKNGIAEEAVLVECFKQRR